LTEREKWVRGLALPNAGRVAGLPPGASSRGRRLLDRAPTNHRAEQQHGLHLPAANHHVSAAGAVPLAPGAGRGPGAAPSRPPQPVPQCPPGTVRLNVRAKRLARRAKAQATAGPRRRPLFFQTPVVRGLLWGSGGALAAGTVLLGFGHDAGLLLLLLAAAGGDLRVPVLPGAGRGQLSGLTTLGCLRCASYS